MKRNRTRRGATIAALALAAGLAGCARNEHLRADHGIQSRAFFDRQAQAARSGDAQGLDSEEAALIHESYHQSLGKRRARQAEGSQMLILEGGDHAENRRR